MPRSRVVLETEARRVWAAARQHDFERGERKDGRDRLRHVGDAARARARLDRGERRAVEKISPRAGFEQPAEQSDERRLARAVRADERRQTSRAATTSDAPRTTSGAPLRTRSELARLESSAPPLAVASSVRS